jgi:hypothetical protein
MTDLIRDLNKVLDAMRDVVTEDQTVELLVYIEATQRELDTRLRVLERVFREDLLRSLLPDGDKK